MKIYFYWFTFLVTLTTIHASDINKWRSPYGPYTANGRITRTSSNSVIYKCNDGSSILLVGISSLNRMLKEMSLTKDESTSYVHLWLSYLVYNCIACDNDEIIDNGIVARPASAAKLSTFEQAIASKYRSGIQFTSNGDSVLIHFYVWKTSGAVESWEITCRSFPIQISRFSQKIVEPEGAFPRGKIFG